MLSQVKPKLKIIRRPLLSSMTLQNPSLIAVEVAANWDKELIE